MKSAEDIAANAIARATIKAAARISDEKAVDVLADRIERAGMIENGETAFTSDDAGYASILKAFYPQDRAVLIAALRNCKSEEKK